MLPTLLLRRERNCSSFMYRWPYSTHRPDALDGERLVSGTCNDSATILDRGGELVFDVPGEVNPLGLLELLDEAVDDRPAGGLRVEAGEMRLGQELAHGLRGLAGVDQVVDQQVAVAGAAHALENLDAVLLLLSRAGLACAVAGDADGVDQADVELARDQRCGHQAAARHGDDALPRAFLVQELGEVARIAVQLYPGDDDFVFVGDARHAEFYLFA